MTMPSCSLWILVARTDVQFMMHTIPHLVRMSSFPFKEKVLAIDTAPLSGEKTLRPHVGTLQQVRDNCEKLLHQGIIDRVVDINYDPHYHQQIYLKHFGALMHQTHNFKGYPVLGSIFAIEEAKSDYILHFDSDMMVYQQPNFSWIKEGIETIEQHPELVSMRPLAGPPQPDGDFYQSADYEKGEGNYYRFKFFGSRVYLVNYKRFEQLLPLPIIWMPYRRKFVDKLPTNLKTWFNYFAHKGKLHSWEVLVTKKLEQTPYYRGMLSNSHAWTLHPNIRSQEFFEALPSIIERIEKGDYPEKQAGYYDLDLPLWI